MNKHIDVRGVHPVYINGLVAVTLEGCNRDITIEQAEEWIKQQELLKVEVQVEVDESN